MQSQQRSILYQPLEAGYFRLIRLHPTHGDSDLVSCRLETYHLSQIQHQYHALSYVCGDQNDKVSIRVNGLSRLVTKNLWEALSTLAAEGFDQSLFVDAISISQDDEVEKAQQVKLMHSIYSSAMMVIAWLGPELPTDEAGLSLMKELLTLRNVGEEMPSLQRLKQQVTGESLDSFNSSQDITAMVFSNMSETMFSEAAYEFHTSTQLGRRLNALDYEANIDEASIRTNTDKWYNAVRKDDRWDALNRIVQRPYVSRMWIVQEASCARYCTMRIGRLSMDAEDFFRVAQDLRNYGLKQATDTIAQPFAKGPFSNAYVLSVIRDRARRGSSTERLDESTEQLPRPLRMFELLAFTQTFDGKIQSRASWSAAHPTIFHPYGKSTDNTSSH
jgi:hypothetical protein